MRVHWYSGVRVNRVPPRGAREREFWRPFSLPETVKHDAIEAAYKDGVLEIRVPKAEETKPRQIEVTVH